MILIHAGAGDSCGETPEQVEQIRVDLKKAALAGFDALKKTDDASEAVCAAIHVLEDATEFNAGRGAALTEDGKAQMDACLMTGDGDAGSVFGVTCAKHPIDAAKAVKECTKHVCMDNPSEELLGQLGVETVENEYFITDARREMLAKAKEDGDGGVIVMSPHGEAVVAFNSEMMNFAFADDDQAIPFPLEDGLE